MPRKPTKKTGRSVTKTVQHPPYAEMVAKAILAEGNRKGSSRQAITKYILTNYEGFDEGKLKVQLKLAFTRLTTEPADGTGAQLLVNGGRFKCSPALKKEFDDSKPEKKTLKKEQEDTEEKDSCSSFKQCVGDLMVYTTEAEEKIEVIRQTMIEHQHGTSVSKTVGSGLSIVGGVLSFLVPVGLPILACGAIKSLRTILRDYQVSEEESQKIVNVLNQLQRDMTTFLQHLRNIDELKDQIMSKKQNLLDVEALKIAWYIYTEKGVKLAWNGYKLVGNMKNLSRFLTANKLGKYGLRTLGGAPFAFKLACFFGSSKDVAIQFARFVRLGLNGFSVVCIGLDVWNIIDTWTSTNPTVTQATEVISNLREFKTKLYTIRKEL